GQLTEVRQGAVTGTLVAAFVYDANGNVIRRCEGGAVSRTDTDCSGSTLMTLSYDELDRMTQAARTGQSRETYVYDDQGRRIQKTVGTAITNYLYDGSAIVAEYGSAWGSP